MAQRVDAIRAMLQKSPDDVFLHYSLGMELAGAGDHDQAVQEFRRCIELDATYLPAYVEAGKALRSAGRRDQAREMFRQAMELAQAQGQSHVATYVRQQLEGLGLL